jgi:hypothetical protein
MTIAAKPHPRFRIVGTVENGLAIEHLGLPIVSRTLQAPGLRGEIAERIHGRDRGYAQPVELE